jgi:uncharacterized membrane protein YidH (DUF202 family)
MNNPARIRRVSTLLKLACDAYLLLAPLLLAAIWLNFEQLGPQWQTLAQLPIQPQYVGLINKLLGALITAIPLVLLMYGVWRLRKLFEQFRQGKLFSESGADHLHAFAWTLLITMLMAPVVSALLSLVLTMNNPPGEKALVITLGSNDFGQLFIAGALFAITWTLREGYRLSQENEAFV